MAIDRRDIFNGPVWPWPGRSATGSVILPLGTDLLDHLPSRWALPEAALVRKSEVHLTLLSTKEAEALAARLPEPEWAKAFCTESWAMTPLERFDLLREERPPEPTRFSIIRHVDCPSLNAFRERLAQASGLALAATLPHVTLYTAGHERGIGLASLADHERFRMRTLALAECP